MCTNYFTCGINVAPEDSHRCLTSTHTTEEFYEHTHTELVKGVPAGQAKILTCENNFHGRTTTIVGFSTDPDSTGGFGPSAIYEARQPPSLYG